MALTLSTGNLQLGSLIKKIATVNYYPSELEVYLMRSLLVEGGPPPLNTQDYIKNYSTPISETDIPCELPPGYPANLPRPYYLPGDGRIVLKKVPVIFELSNADIGWVMVALQNAINTYSRHPYPINWEVAKYGSGFGHIYETCKQDITPNNFVFWKFWNYAEPPDTGGDPLGQMFLGTVLKLIPFGNIVGNTLNLFSTMTAGSGPTTNLPPPLPGTGSGNTSPVQQDGEQPGGGATDKSNWWIWAAVAAGGLILYELSNERD